MKKSTWKLHYLNGKVRWYSGDKYDEERDNFVWDDKLEYDGYGRGCSSCVIFFKSLNDRKEYTMFMTDFNDIVDLLNKGCIEGQFTFCKRGMNYGIKKI